MRTAERQGRPEISTISRECVCAGYVSFFFLDSLLNLLHPALDAGRMTSIVYNKELSYRFTQGLTWPMGDISKILEGGEKLKPEYLFPWFLPRGVTIVGFSLPTESHSSC